MILGTRKTLYDHIIEALFGKSLSVHEIEAYLKGKNTTVTVQGIYKALRELISEDIVVKHKKTYAISTIWRDRLANLVTTQAYQFKLSPGEHVSYTFNKLEHIDAFWKHSLNDIDKEIGAFPVFDFCPHNFWMYVPGREISEQGYYQSFIDNKTYLFSILGGTTTHDKRKKTDLSTDFHRVHLDDDVAFNRRDHITAMGPYVITTRVSLKLSREVDELYQIPMDEEELVSRLHRLFRRPGRIIMSIEHNIGKAKKLRKRISKDFYIPSELREQFDLF